MVFFVFCTFLNTEHSSGVRSILFPWTWQDAAVYTDPMSDGEICDLPLSADFRVWEKENYTEYFATLGSIISLDT